MILTMLSRGEWKFTVAGCRADLFITAPRARLPFVIGISAMFLALSTFGYHSWHEASITQMSRGRLRCPQFPSPGERSTRKSFHRLSVSSDFPVAKVLEV